MPYPTEVRRASPEWDLCVQIAQWLQQHRQPGRQGAQGTPLAIDGPRAPTAPMITDRPVQLGKRPTEEAPREDSDEESVAPSQSSQTASQRSRKRQYKTLAEWPADWRGQYEAFKAAGREEARRRLWQTWDSDLRDQVYASAAAARRTEMRRWEEAEEAQPQERHPGPPQGPDKGETSQASRAASEPTSHNWKEGERIGEAKNPGPPPSDGPNPQPHDNNADPRVCRRSEPPPN
jgi:hypothetical protein